MSRRNISLLILLVLILMLVVLLMLLLTSIKSGVVTSSVQLPDSWAAARRGLHLVYAQPRDTRQDEKRALSELRRVADSLRRELLQLERQRAHLVSSSRQLASSLTALRREQVVLRAEQHRLRVTINTLQLHQDEIERSNLPVLRLPLSHYHLEIQPSREPTLTRAGVCDMETCFDYKACPLARLFTVKYASTPNHLRNVVINSPYTTDSQKTSACVNIYFNKLTSDNTVNRLLYRMNSSKKWSEVIDRVIVADTTFNGQSYRSGYDVVMPSAVKNLSETLWQRTTPLLPARRAFLFSFQGYLKNSNKLPSAHDSVVKELLKTSKLSKSDKFFLEFRCSDTEDTTDESPASGEWHFCGSESSRRVVLSQSTFALIISPVDKNKQVVSTAPLQHRLLEALLSGAVPVLLGGAHLPMEELLPWSGVVIRLPTARVPELHFMLRTLPDSDIVEMRRRGRLLLDRYLGSADSQLESLLLLLRRRLLLPSARAPDVASNSVFPSGSPPQFVPVTNQYNEIDDYLGPVEGGALWPQFQRNFSTLFLTDQLFDPDPFRSPSFSPWAPVLPTEAQFRVHGGSSFAFRPVDHTLGTAGVEFSRALGGNIPQEKFTVVLLSYRRSAVLLTALEKLKDLPYLHSAVVVWNAVGEIPDKSLRWPNIGVPIHVVKMKINSLNNRFLPLDVIKTEAVLSMDDDTMLRQDEIIFAFRVWRENRDRLVGFPARFHQWDSGSHTWRYNSNKTCEYSMILTGAAFINKYYFHLYTNIMPAVIRARVDKDMNCEDLAMNFLVSHVTRKPPIKVTSRWTFRCPECKTSLFMDESHFTERHRCTEFFSKVYGYNPLLYSQFRADSVLFKTRVSADQQKCFKYI